jgi:lysyl-tRNA synthetase, class I
MTAPSSPTPSVHWADITADKIIRERGDKELYTLASGITPSGIVHFGNFRETLTVDLVARALKAKGKKVRFIFSWDDFDTFRKVPKNVPNPEEFVDFLFQPIVDIPDPWKTAGSYAAHHEQNYERELRLIGVEAECLYQAQKYRSGEYAEGILKALQHTESIKAILNKYRSTPLADDWLPVSLYCPVNKTDKMESVTWDGDVTLHYVHSSGFSGSLNLSNSADLPFVKLPWRIDWPMRWVHEKVDFEPGGKDHSSDGGSFSTGKEIVSTVFGGIAPLYLQYDFVSVKGKSGKMSSSSGDVVTVTDLLCLYEPEIVRWIYASYKPNVDFAIGFDADVIKTYEDFDRSERIACGLEPGSEKKFDMAKRVYELSALDGKLPSEKPFQPAFRHLTVILQIYDGDIERARAVYADDIRNDWDEKRFQTRARCALYWLENYAPDEFVFSVNQQKIELDHDAKLKGFVSALGAMLSNEWESFATDKDLHERMYEVIHAHEITPADAFRAVYLHLISREKGPRLASFMLALGKDRVVPLLS